MDASYQGDKVKVIEFKAAFENAPIKVEISKTDITGEKELPGAKLSVIDADGKLVESWTSEAGKTHMIERLPVGKYTLREESAPYGYKVASDVTFEVKETAEIQKVSMKDEQAVGKIVIEKTVVNMSTYTDNYVNPLEMDVWSLDPNDSKGMVSAYYEYQESVFILSADKISDDEIIKIIEGIN